MFEMSKVENTCETVNMNTDGAAFSKLNVEANVYVTAFEEIRRR